MSSPQGNTALDERKISERFVLEDTDVKIPIGISTPLIMGSRDTESLFKMNYAIEDQILDNLKNLLMTKKGERLGFEDYGTDLWKVYNSGYDKEKILDFAMAEIQATVNKYIPSIELANFYSSLVEKFTTNDSLEAPNEFYKADKAREFYEKQNNVEILPNKISLNSSDPNVDEIYKITVEYKIPNISSKDSYSVCLYLRTSK
jgi:phage baseplate assembly protein W